MMFDILNCVCVCGQAVYSSSVPEDIATNKGILTVGATDADSGSSAEIQYSLFGIGVEDFYMDANTGNSELFHGRTQRNVRNCQFLTPLGLFVCLFVFCLQGELRTATALDREVASAYKLIAQATDAGGLFCRSDISLRVLDVNDNVPSFSAPYYLASVYENAAPKALLTRLQASDPDEGELI